MSLSAFGGNSNPIVDAIFEMGERYGLLDEEDKRFWEIIRYSGDGKNSLDSIMFKCPYCGAEFNNRSEHCGRCGKKVE